MLSLAQILPDYEHCWNLLEFYSVWAYFSLWKVAEPNPVAAIIVSQRLGP
ncbi:MAG: hypothetical protein QXF23_03760 [Candidatus Bathyarchaeia archaeon]